MKKYLGLLISILLLGACTEKGRPIHGHQQDSRQSAPDTATQSQAYNEPSHQLKGQSLQSLADRVLSHERIRDPKSRASRAVLDELLALNSMLLKNPDEAILSRYAEALNLDCEEIKSSCFGLLYFRMAANSSQVARLAAQRSASVEESTRLILIALEIKNSNFDADLLGLLLEKGNLLAAHSNVKLRDTVRSMLDTSLMTADQKTTDGEELRKLLTRIKAWDLVNNKSWGLSSSAENALWSMIARARMMPQNGGTGSADFEKFAARISADPQSAIVRQQVLRAKKMFDPAALGTGFIEKLDDMNLLADAVFTGQLTPQNAAVLFLSTGRTAAQLAAAIEGYARLRFAFAVHESTLEAEKIFKANVTTEQLLFHSLRQSSLVKQIWDRLQGRMNQLKSFASIALKALPDGQDAEKNLSMMFSSYGRSVEMTAVYPHMLVLFYYLSQKNFELFLRFGGKLNSADLMTHLYHGLLGPLMDYSDETKPLNYFEILYSFDMAVRTRLFQTMDIDVDTFMSNTLSRLSEESVQFVQTELDSVGNRFQASTGFRELRNACAEFKTGERIPRVLNLEDMRTSPYYGKLMETANTTVSSKGSRSGMERGSLPQLEMGLFYADDAFSETVEKVRLDFQSYIRTANAMLASYSDYLEKFEKLSATDIAKRTEKTRAVIDRLEKLSTRVLQDAAKYQNDLGTCYYKMNLHDFDVYSVLLKKEESYLRQVHRDIKQLRAGQALQNSYEFTGLPSGFKGLDRIDKDGYTATDLDLIIRVARYMKEIAPQITVNMGSKLDVDVEMVRSPNQKRLIFTESEDEFVNSGLRAYFSSYKSFVHWHTLTGGRVSTWTSYVKTQASLYRLEQDLFRTNNIVSARQVLEAQEQILKMLEISPTDRRLYSTIKLSHRFDPLALDNRIISFAILQSTQSFGFQDTWALYDLPAIFMNMEKLGYDYDISLMGPEFPQSMKPKRYGFRQLAKMYYDSRSVWNRGRPIVPYNPALDRALDQNVTRFVRNESNAITGFYAEADKYLAEINARPVTQRPRADIDMKMSVTELMSDNLPRSFRADQLTLGQDTQNCFVRKCMDFK